MVHKLIQTAASTWAHAPDCPLRAQLDYMRRRGGLRPVQIDAVETYLFLKVACGNRPLRDILATGLLNTLNPDSLRVSQLVRDYLASHPEALALLQFASLPVSDGRGVLAPTLRARLEDDPQSIDASAVFNDLFYGVPYSDYLFSLPMGAGKTFLMAAFIYLDLAFALQEPDNSAFARNFLVLAPSGLKSSIVPSLRTIQAFDPSWVVAEPLASRLRRQLRFMVLDAETSASRSNRVRNPNVQKLASLQPFDDLVGLVAVTNAEKVILDRLGDGQPELFDRTEDERAAAANELRATIAKIPALSIFIDEAHHTPARNQASKLSGEAANEVKLRRVVSKWAAQDSVRTVLGFSGTPYLASPERISVAEGLEIKTSEIANTVHYFPLVDGIGDFLKMPSVQIVRDAPDSLDIVQRGISEFLARFRDKRYSSGAYAKLAVYCGTIARLETQILPLAVKLCEENGLDPAASILRYHRGDRAFPAPEGAELSFAALDSAHSTVRIILLVQIGKEGWDCRSLAGVVLSQEGDCPTNMVLQTSCRCLRDPEGRSSIRTEPEEAVVVLNESNGRQLADQLKKQQHATLDEFQRGANAPVRLERFDRTKALSLPDLPFFQLRVSYGAEIVEDADTPTSRLRALLADLPSLRRRTEVATGTFDDLASGGVAEESPDHYGLVPGDTPSRPFRAWLDLMQ
ncbi:MAG: DEAD/DEAH box helicase family protein, partial [Kiritimatiellae bacterium]|nr:DEAD/DEAH box helicase family protein [Kiritimatiellia bacterium]